ncbi:RraA family protein [Asanoa iriomotensis]|uniref:Putative 4-hydroxy-4-methyl-2-oxoglutarate aldolase n=1 Tax=Asanoa iriomotensis TaxID=234613 RepID=A0ABQ4BYC0_9ACTN|nr:hypothetical protein [Asanoa iriomotensis]GIF55534.1 methyltransferase [Asanoa iriomotensis]
MSVGFRVFGRGAMPTAAQVKAYFGMESSNVADAMHGLGAMSADVAPVYRPMRAFAGPALTVTVSPGNGMMIRKAIAASRPGDVIVVNAGGVRSRAVLGGNVAIDIVAHGIAGVVIDGAVRDVDELRALDLPVYAVAVTPRSGSDPSGRGEVLAPTACGGVAVVPGDIVVGDADGVTVVPLADADAVLSAALAVRARKGGADDLDARLASARAGTLTAYDPAAVARALAAAGCADLTSPWRDLS